MYNVIFITYQITPFTAPWGAVCSPERYISDNYDGWILPLGWEDELTARGIDFEIIELEEETP